MNDKQIEVAFNTLLEALKLAKELTADREFYFDLFRAGVDAEWITNHYGYEAAINAITKGELRVKE